MNDAERGVSSRIAEAIFAIHGEFGRWTPDLADGVAKGVLVDGIRKRWPHAVVYHDAGWRVEPVYYADTEIAPNRDDGMGCGTEGEAIGLAWLAANEDTT